MRPHVRRGCLLRRLLALLPLVGGSLCALTLLLAAGCTPKAAPVTGVTFVLPDSIRYVTPDRNQPYALLWPQQGVMNLWLFVSQTRACRTGIEDRYYRREYSAVMRASRTAGGFSGVLTACTDTTVSGSLVLTEVTPDSLAGLALMQSTDACGEVRDTLALTLVRQP